jgi:hypothetical protein
MNEEILTDSQQQNITKIGEEFGEEMMKAYKTALIIYMLQIENIALKLKLRSI